MSDWWFYGSVPVKGFSCRKPGFENNLNKLVEMICYYFTLFVLLSSS